MALLFLTTKRRQKLKRILCKTGNGPFLTQELEIKYLEFQKMLKFRWFTNVKFGPTKKSEQLGTKMSSCAALERNTTRILLIELDVICERIDVVFANLKFSI